MLWSLLIWVVVGFVATFLWPGMVLVRAERNGYELDVYAYVVNTLLDEHNAEMKGKYNPVVYFVLMVFYNVLWPYKLAWFTKNLVPKCDEYYEDLVLEKLEKGEHA